MTRFYVSMTWHDWPKGGSYGTVVEAQSYADAETLCRAEMASTYAADNDADDYHLSEEAVIEAYSHEWRVVDCFLLDDFLKRHNGERNAKIAAAVTALEDLLDSEDVQICRESGGIIDYQTTEIRKLIA